MAAPDETGEPTMPVPGLLSCTSLAVNNGQTEEKQIAKIIAGQDAMFETKINNSQHFLNAARNLKGLMLYRSDRKAGAIKLWKEALEHDPANINALRDLATAYSEQGNDPEAERYEALCQQATGGENSPDDTKMIYARCKMEQAHALRKDMNTELRGIDLRRLHVQWCEDAFSIAGDSIEREQFEEEKRDWLQFRGKMYGVLSLFYLKVDDKEMSSAFIVKAVDDFHQCLQLSEQSTAYQAHVWYRMGKAIAECNNKLDIPSGLISDIYLEEWKDPLRCYLTSNGLHPDCVWILGRLGTYHFKIGELDNALYWLDRAIDVAESPENHLQKITCCNALYHRAKIWVKKFNRAQRNRGRARESLEFLTRAKADLERAAEYVYDASVIAYMGEVYHRMAMHSLTERRDADKLMDEALEKFEEASASQDPRATCNTHFKWARCLTDKNDLPSAIRKYKIAFDSALEDSYESFSMMLGRDLLCAMFDNFRQEHKPPALLESIAHQFVHIHNRFALCSCKFQFHLLPKCYASEILEAIEYILDNIAVMSDDVNDLSRGMLQETLEDMSNWKYVRDQIAFKERVHALLVQNSRYH